MRVDDTNPRLDQLRLAGISRLSDGRLRVRNRIYARVFDRRWVIQHMPDAELRRQQAAFRRGVARAAAIAALIVAVVGGLALAAWNLARRERAAHRQTELARQRADRLLYIANMNLAQSDWENSNIGRIGSMLAETRENPARGFEWGYWQRLCHLDLMTLAGHSAPVTSIAYSPDGARLLTGGEDGTTRGWDARTGHAILTVPGGPAAAFSSDGRRIATAGPAGLRLWDARSGHW